MVKKIISRFKKNLSMSGVLPDISYSKWIKDCEPQLFTTNKLPSFKPLLTIVVPAFNTPDKYILPLIYSLIEQKYPNWQLCLADGSTDPLRAMAIKSASGKDSRIQYIKLKRNLGIAGNTNEGSKLARGEYIAFVDHDDTLSPHALMEVVKLLNKRPNAEIIYSDEDKLSDDGKSRLLPFFKPDWSPSLLEGVNYMPHFLVIKKRLFDSVGGLRLGFDGAQDYDLLLRITEKTKKIYHIPKILYHWRMAAGSTARAIGEKKYADDAGQRALTEHIKRQNIKANVVAIEDRPTNYRLQYTLPKNAKASIIIPFRDKVEYLKKLIPTIIKNSNGVNFEIILISNNSVEQKTIKYLQNATRISPKIKIYKFDKPFNFSAINNFGRSKATGNYLVFLNNDTEVLTDNWLEELIGVAAQKNTGAVGPMLLYPDTRIQHAGVILGMKTMAGHVFRLRKEDELTPFGLASWPRNYLAVTGACLVVSVQKFDEIGGFDEKMIVAGSDVALCIKLYEKGYQMVYWPFVKLVHYESVTVGTYDNGIIGDYNRSLTYYTPYLDWKDPYFNQNLDLMNESVDLRSKYEE
ncbi:MAG: glycosyltransferase family 2 protein [Candidatus Saccharimonadales bacterium]